MFYKDEKKDQQRNNLLTASNVNVEKPVRCYSCKQNKLNHIVSESVSHDPDLEHDEIRKQILKMS